VSYAEKQGRSWRARWRGPGGTLESKSGFRTRKDAEKYGRDQEAAIRNNTYVDPRAGRITLTEWVNKWFPALDLELNTLSTYRYTIEVHILPAFGDRSLRWLELEPEAIALWEKQIAARGYTRRTAREARSTLASILADAIPRYIQSNPAARRPGKGRKGQRRIERAEKAEKTWATALEVLLFAERCSVLSGTDTDFAMVITMAYTGMRWSEAMGLLPGCIHGQTMDIAWKLYELDARFYRGRPKDGSIRTVDVPPFLDELLTWHLGTSAGRKCTCRNTEPPWCPGDEYVFLGPQNGHFRRSNYAARVVRPAADGRYPGRQGRHAREPSPVLVDMSGLWPGTPLPPWPPAQPGVPFTPPAGRGIPRLAGKEGSGRCPACNRTVLLRRDGLVISHKAGDVRCPGSGQEPAENLPIASWLPLRAGLTPHGLRHGHQTWLDEMGVRYVLQSERMGHEVPGMRGVYSHITPGMREALTAGLQALWEASLRERARIATRSPVRVLDVLLGPFRENTNKIGSQSAPKTGHLNARRPGRRLGRTS
jgi:integrase